MQEGKKTCVNIARVLYTHLAMGRDGIRNLKKPLDNTFVSRQPF